MPAISHFNRRKEEAAFIGNRDSSSLDLIGPDRKTLREKYLIGRPQDCEARPLTKWSGAALSEFI